MRTSYLDGTAKLIIPEGEYNMWNNLKITGLAHSLFVK